jgi:hypothetical protein
MTRDEAKKIALDSINKEIELHGIDICGMKNIHLYQKIFKNKQTF